MNILNFKVKNGFTWKTVEIDLMNQGLIHISGENGSGKSVIWELLEHILFENTSRGSNKNSIIRPGSKSFTGELLLENPDNGDLFKIIQIRKKRGSNLTIFKKQQDATWLDITDKKTAGKNEPQDQVSKLLGLGKIEYEGSAYLTQESSHILVNGTGTERKKYLSSLFDLDIYDIMQQTALTEMKQYKERKEEIIKVESTLAELDEQLAEFEDDLDSTYNEIIEDIKTTRKITIDYSIAISETENYYSQLSNIERQLTSIKTKPEKAIVLPLSQKINEAVTKLESSVTALQNKKLKLTKAQNAQTKLQEYAVQKTNMPGEGSISQLESIISKDTKQKELTTSNYSDCIKLQQLFVEIQKLKEQVSKLFIKKNTYDKKDIDSIILFSGTQDLDKVVPLLKDNHSYHKAQLTTMRSSLAELKSDHSNCSVCSHPLSSKYKKTEVTRINIKLTDTMELLKLTEYRINTFTDYLNIIQRIDFLNMQIYNVYTQAIELESPIFKGNPDDVLNIDTILQNMQTTGESLKLQAVQLQNNLKLNVEYLTTLNFINKEINKYKELGIDTAVDYSVKLQKVNTQLVTLNIKLKSLLNKQSIIDSVLPFFNTTFSYLSREKLQEVIIDLKDRQGDLATYLQEKGEYEANIKLYTSINARKSKLLKTISDKNEIIHNYYVKEALYKTIPKVKSALLHNLLRDLQDLLPQYVDYLFGEEDNNKEFIVSESENSVDLVRRIYMKDYHYDIPSKSLSTGEKQIFSIALLWTLQRMISKNKKLNFLIMDEVDKGLSSNRIEALSNLINDKKQEVGTLILISHREEFKNSIHIDKQWKIVKTNDVSALVQEI